MITTLISNCATSSNLCMFPYFNFVTNFTLKFHSCSFENNFHFVLKKKKRILFENLDQSHILIAIKNEGNDFER